jgi:NDP-sugar pyrophosphorylase family protein
MKAVIFAAGLGTRLRPLTDNTPKPLIDIGGKSILQRTLEALPHAIDGIVVVVGYKGELIKAAIDDRRVRFVEQPELRGTHDALMRAKDLLQGDPFLALNGDDLYARQDLERLAAEKPFALLAHKVPTPNPYSHLETDEGLLKRIVLNKDAEGLAAHDVYVGACLLDGRFFDLDPAVLPSGEYGLPQTLAKHLNTIPVQVIASSFWQPVGTPDELEIARKRFAS